MLMERSATKRTILWSAGGVVAIAFVTAWLRATSDLWWPAFSLTLDSPLRGGLAWLLALSWLVALFGFLDRILKWSRPHAAVVVVAGFVIGFLIGTLVRGDTRLLPPSARERAYESRLSRVTARKIGFGEVPGGMMCSPIAVIEEEGVRRAAHRLRCKLVAAYRDGFLNYIIIVGGPDVERVDRVLRRAVRWLPEHRGSIIKIVLVTPEPVPDNTREKLQSKGLKVEQAEYEPPPASPAGWVGRRIRRPLPMNPRSYDRRLGDRK
jgi:hypothetical protein